MEGAQVGDNTGQLAEIGRVYNESYSHRTNYHELYSHRTNLPPFVGHALRVWWTPEMGRRLGHEFDAAFVTVAVPP